VLGVGLLDLGQIPQLDLSIVLKDPKLQNGLALNAAAGMSSGTLKPLIFTSRLRAKCLPLRIGLKSAGGNTVITGADALWFFPWRSK
jgi:hypothetical protein